MELTEIYEQVQAECSVTHEMMDMILEQYGKDLDDLIDRIHNYLTMLKNGEVDEYTDEQLEIDFALLSTEMYRTSSVLAKLGGESDMAERRRKEFFNNAILRVTGTQVEKKARAENKVLNHQIIEDVLKRVYDQLKRKLDMADSVYSALKKIYSKRLVEFEVFRKEYNGTNRSVEGVEERWLR